MITEKGIRQQKRAQVKREKPQVFEKAESTRLFANGQEHC